MQSKYIYSGTITNVLTARLLSSTQRELLLGTTSVAEVRKLLQDTAIAPFLIEGRSIREAIDAFRNAQRDFLVEVAPDPKALSILLSRYDFENVKQIMRGSKQSLSDEVILASLNSLGIIAPDTLLKATTSGKLPELHPDLALAYASALALADESVIGDHFDYAYLTYARGLAKSYKGSFLERYMILQIDLHNIGMRLRVLTHPENNNLIVQGTFVAGGSIEESELSTMEKAIKTIKLYSRNTEWQQAVAAYVANQDFAALDRVSDNHLMQFLRRESIDIHSPASLFAYFHTVLEHTQFIEAIVGAHSAGLDGPTLRTLIRTSFMQHDF